MVSTNLDTARITGQYVLFDGTPRVGSVVFSASVILVDAVANQVLFSRTYTAPLDSLGRISTNSTTAYFDLPGTDDPDVDPQGWTWQVQEVFTDGGPVGRSFSMLAPVGTTIKITTVSPVVPAPGVVAYVTQSSKGQPDGVGTLDSTGHQPYVEVTPLTVNALGSAGSAKTIPTSTAPLHTATLTAASCTLTFTTTLGADRFQLELTQDATGSRTVTWPGSVRWAGGSAPTISAGAGSVTLIEFYTRNSGSIWRGRLLGTFTS